MNELAGLSVLLVEDEYLIALDAAEILKTLGAKEVEIIATFERAERRAADGQFDLAVLDVNINGRFSFPIASTIAERGIPFVFATGYELGDHPAHGLDDALCVTKPYTRDRLKDALSTALAKAAPKQ
jgi:CheY-like chemotaxis protein